MVTRVQPVPVHFRTTPLVGPSPLPLSPTAQDLLEWRDATAKRLIPPPNVGVGTWPHVCPFHHAIKLVPGPQPQLLPFPTAQMVPPDDAATPLKKLERPCPAPGSGLGVGCHVFPFQCWMRVSPLFVEPTAHAFWGEIAATPERVPAVLGICCHDFPFQCRMRGWSPLFVEPTAHALGEIAATPERVPAVLGSRCHLLPFQCRINALVSGSAPLYPTAHALESEVAATLRSTAPGGLGLATGFQRVSFQWRVNEAESELVPE